MELRLYIGTEWIDLRNLGEKLLNSSKKGEIQQRWF